jgi:hypothetical protein
MRTKGVAGVGQPFGCPQRRQPNPLFLSQKNSDIYHNHCVFARNCLTQTPLVGIRRNRSTLESTDMPEHKQMQRDQLEVSYWYKCYARNSNIGMWDGDCSIVLAEWRPAPIFTIWCRKWLDC